MKNIFITILLLFISCVSFCQMIGYNSTKSLDVHSLENIEKIPVNQMKFDSIYDYSFKYDSNRGFFYSKKKVSVDTFFDENKWVSEIESNLGSYNLIIGKEACYQCNLGNGNIIIGDSLAMGATLTDDNWIVNYDSVDKLTAKKLRKFSKIYRNYSRKKRMEEVCEIMNMLCYY